SRHQGPGHLRLCHADGRRAADRGTAQGIDRLGAQGDRPDRFARPDPVRSQSAEDALRQDHAPHPAQDRRGRVRQSGRSLDIDRSGRRRRPRDQPAEQEKRIAGTCNLAGLGGRAYDHAMTALTKPRMNVDEFLSWAVDQPGRFELFRGEVYAMSPQTVGHAKVKGAVYRGLLAAVRKSGYPCHVLPDGAPVRVDDATAYEPDALLYCGQELAVS